MEARIVVDSCCDMTPEIQKELVSASIPFDMIIDDVRYTDDAGLDLPGFMGHMKNCPSKAGSSAPSPLLYKEAYTEGTGPVYAITISSKLSASHTSAVLGKTMAEEEADADVHVFDSKSASAGELLIALRLKDLIQSKLPKPEIIQTLEHFIDEMKTYFVLECYDNLLKNGRLRKIEERLIRVLGIKLVMGSDGNGNIALYSKARGRGKVIEKLSALIAGSGRCYSENRLVISHCNNPDFAQALADTVRGLFNFKEIVIVPTGGLSSLYADNQGIILAF